MKVRLREILTQVETIETRLIRVESRIVQIMNHFGIKPKGVIPESGRKKPPPRPQ